MLLVFVLFAIALERASRGAARTYGGARGKTTARPAPERLRGSRAAVATSICALAVLLGFALPVLLLLRLIAGEPDVAWTTRFFAWSWNSLRVAVLAAVLAVLFATLMAYALRLAPGRITRIGSLVLTLGYAVPGTVLAVGVLLPLGALDNALDVFWRERTGNGTGLLLTGTAFALIYAYLVRYFAVAWNGIEPGFARITPAMDAAARSLGAGALATFRRVHVPLLTRSGAAALLLVFVDVMKELPATLVLRPFNFDTLATQTYLFAKDERLAEAALPSLAIVAVGLVPIIALARISRRSRADAHHPPGLRRNEAALAP
jgi:iron(III) transport system permease protein